jgi:hypothetical protein
VFLQGPLGHVLANLAVLPCSLITFDRVLRTAGLSVPVQLDPSVPVQYDFSGFCHCSSRATGPEAPKNTTVCSADINIINPKIWEARTVHQHLLGVWFATKGLGKLYDTVILSDFISPLTARLYLASFYPSHLAYTIKREKRASTLKTQLHLRPLRK